MGSWYRTGDEWDLKAINGIVFEVRNCIYHDSTR